MNRALMILMLSAPLAVMAHDANHETQGGHLSGLVDCGSGVADGYACARIDLLSWLDIDQLGGTHANDIWGWTDSLDGREYVLIGRFAGTTFVDITDPQAPVVLGYLPAHPDIVAGHAASGLGSSSSSGSRGESCKHDEGHDEVCGAEGSAWRDLKVYQDHAYIVSEQFGAGLQVFDLTQLRGVVGAPVIFDETAFDGLFGSAHNVAINEDSGFLYVVGSTRASGGLVIYDLTDPAAPAWVADFSEDGYTHDVQCVNYHGPDTDHTGEEICFASNEDTLTIIDVTDKGAMSVIKRSTYSGVSYSHQAWLSEDHSYLYSNDELDEYYGGGHTRTRIWDVRNLEGARVTTAYDSPLWSIDHNNYVVGDYLFQSNYTSGLRVLDISNPTQPWEIGYFDTFPANDLAEFEGTWSNYPYFPSGTIAVSDITGGLFLLQADFVGAALAVSDLEIDVGTQAIIVRVGDRVDRTITVSNLSGVAAPDTQVTVSLDGIDLVSLSSVDGTCTVTGETARCRLGTLAAGDSATISYRYEAIIAGQVKISAMVSGLIEDTTAGNNRGGLSFPVIGSGTNPTPPPSNASGGGSAPAIALLLSLAAGLRRRWPLAARP